MHVLVIGGGKKERFLQFSDLNLLCEGVEGGGGVLFKKAERVVKCPVF